MNWSFLVWQAFLLVSGLYIGWKLNDNWWLTLLDKIASHGLTQEQLDTINEEMGYEHYKAK